MGPVSHSDGHDAPGLIGYFVPGFTAVIDDVLVVLEDAVGQVVVAHELPEVFRPGSARAISGARGAGLCCPVDPGLWWCASPPDRG